MDDLTRRGTRRDALIVDALSAVFDLLSGAEDSAKTRTLLVQAKSFEQAVKHWTAVPPTDAQLEAMFDLVTELHGKVVAATSRPRRTRSSGGT